jgi:V8-like Glu-specific endopeptidase
MSVLEQFGEDADGRDVLGHASIKRNTVNQKKHCTYNTHNGLSFFSAGYLSDGYVS